MKEKFLGVIEAFGPLRIHMSKLIKSNNKRVCLDCGVRITWLNDSGWEGFTQDGVTTQPLCKKCDRARNSITAKIED